MAICSSFLRAQSQPNMIKKLVSERDICSKFITPAIRDRRRAKTDPLLVQECHTPCVDLHKHRRAGLSAVLSERRREAKLRLES